jgi:hypothetical protein
MSLRRNADLDLHCASLCINQPRDRQTQKGRVQETLQAAMSIATSSFLCVLHDANPMTATPTTSARGHTSRGRGENGGVLEVAAITG